MPPTIADTCREHLDFMQWADNRLLEAVAANMPDRITTLQHIYLAEVVWLERVSGNSEALITNFQPPSDIHALRREWPAMHGEWNNWAASCADWTTLIPHRNARGDRFEMPAWQIVLHLVNHGSYHRGQISAAVRAAGFAPPDSDLIIYYRLP